MTNIFSIFLVTVQYFFPATQALPFQCFVCVSGFFKYLLLQNFENWTKNVKIKIYKNDANIGKWVEKPYMAIMIANSQVTMAVLLCSLEELF